MAVVYLATLRGAGGFEKRLVVKQIRAELASDEAFVQRFVAEAKTTVGLSHANIVPVYELGVEQGVYFIAMELAQGVTLSDLLGATGPLSAEEGAYLGVEICRALDYAHRKAGIVHRDVTPRNVLIDEEGAVRLIDFGIATPVSVEGRARERVYGSPGHMPIEQLQGGRLTPATDVFAVGALLLEAWTGRAPFRRATRAESDAALSVPLEPMSKQGGGPALLDELMSRAVAFDAGARPQTAEDLARPLREFLRSADLGDIARRLGARVRRARRGHSASGDGDRASSPVETPATPAMGAGWTPSKSIPPPPVTPATRPLTQPVTETFASRDEVVEWARAPSVRPAAEAPAPTPGAPPLERRRATPFIVATVVVGAVVAALLVARRPGPGPERAAVARGAPPAPRGPAGGPSTLAGAARVPVPALPPARGASSAAPAASLGVPVERASSPTARGPADDPTKGPWATLTFTADLPARVTIDGVSQGSTPVRLTRKAPGRHTITVVSVELAERLTATIDARPGQGVSVHAEFTHPVPVLRIR